MILTNIDDSPAQKKARNLNSVDNEKKFWNPAIETLSADEMKALRWQRLKAQLQYNYEHSEFYREEKFHKVNLTPKDIKTFEDFQKIPVHSLQGPGEFRIPVRFQEKYLLPLLTVVVMLEI